jgi:hypothetical protein
MEKDSTYMEVEGDKTDESMKNVKKLVNKMSRDEVITKEMKKYLIPRYPREGKLKGNPKLHKEGAPYRTIISGIGTPTERIAEIAERELNGYVVSSLSYLQDTTDFLRRLKEVQQPLPEGTLLFCFDVVKLYPSVPAKEGMLACEKALECRPDKTIPTKDVMNMIKVVLDNNTFGVADTHYRQTDGVAIGSRLGKNFACTYMRSWDKELLGHPKTPIFYKRFIDDGFGVWTEGVEALQEFAAHANRIHGNIQVKLRWSSTNIEFLDTMVKIGDGHIWTDLYSKPSNKHQYLQFKSCHPMHTKKALPYGLGVRIRRICQKEEDYERNRKELKMQLRKRGYSGRVIEEQLAKVDLLKREDLLQYKSKKAEKTERVPLVLTYSNLLPDIRDIAKKHMKILHKSERMQQIFAEPPLVAFRRDRNLEDVLVHGKLNRVLKVTEAKCEQCKVCDIISTAPISDTDDKDSYKVVGDQTCKVMNVVYVLRCSKCRKPVYVGETERELRERIGEHMADIRLCRDKAVGNHFNEDGHDISHLTVSVIEKIFDSSRSFRQIKEKGWIRKLKTKMPAGLNTKSQRGMDWS